MNPEMLVHGKLVDVNHLHVFLAHAHASVLLATARQHGFRLTGELILCSACSMTKGNRAPTAHHTTARANLADGVGTHDIAGLFPPSLGGFRYVVMFVDSASRLQRPYGTRDQSAVAILTVVKHFIADMGVPRDFWSDNGTEYMNHSFVEYCNNVGIRRELTAPYLPQQNDPRRAHSGEPTKQDTRHVWESRTLPEHLLGRSQGFYGRGGNYLVDGVIALGLRVLQSVGYRGK